MSDAPQAIDTRKIMIGGILRDARTAAGLSVTQVANKLNLTAQAIEALETNQYERLPGLTFARGYIRSYAKLLGLDDTELAKQFDQSAGLNMPLKSVRSVDQVRESRRVSRGMLQFSVFFVFLIVLGAIYYAWQVFNTEQTDVSNQAAVFERVEVERADGSVHVQTLDEPEDQAVAAALDNPTLVSLQEQLLSEVDEAQALNSTDEDAERNQQTPVVETQAPVATPVEEQVTASAATPAPTAPTAPAAPVSTGLAPGMGDLQLSFENDCWLRVVDANGKEIVSGIKRAGDTLRVTGKAPLDVHLGFAKGVGVIYNGESVDISSAIRAETARIKLGQ